MPECRPGTVTCREAGTAQLLFRRLSNAGLPARHRYLPEKRITARAPGRAPAALPGRRECSLRLGLLALHRQRRGAQVIQPVMPTAILFIGGEHLVELP